MPPQSEADLMKGGPEGQDGQESQETEVGASQSVGQDKRASEANPGSALCERSDTGLARTGDCAAASEAGQGQVEVNQAEASTVEVSKAEVSKAEVSKAEVSKVEAGQAEFDGWAMARFSEDAEDGVRMVRLNTTMIARRGKDKFAVRLGLAVSGCPWLQDEEATNCLDTAEGLELEAAVHVFLQQHKAGVLPVVVCESDAREFIVYLTSTEMAMALVDAMAKDYPDLDLNYYTARDCEWEAFWSLADSLGLLEAGADLAPAHIASC